MRILVPGSSIDDIVSWNDLFIVHLLEHLCVKCPFDSIKTYKVYSHGKHSVTMFILYVYMYYMYTSFIIFFTSTYY